MQATVADIAPKTLAGASRQFTEVYGSALVWNTYLKIILLLAVLVIGGLAGMLYRAQTQLAQVKPVFIRIDEIGRATAINADDATTYSPKDNEIRHYLGRFVESHYRRLRASFRRDYPDSLFFMEPRLRDQIVARDKRTNDAFLINAGAEEIEATVRQVTLSDLSRPPLTAEVDFDQQYYQSGTRQSTKRETFTASIEYEIRQGVPAAFIPVNPLGVQIKALRTYQAFK